ncbi:hypothetical protein QCE92_14045, partial [Staphylococcus aureus]|nr:hypothetical protein [Staphylococcus aureus]
MAGLRFRFAPPTPGHGGGDNNALTIYPDHPVGAAQDNPVISTDPPYYDNVPYADISDFFYVWLRKSNQRIFPEIFSTISVPKSSELVADRVRHGDANTADAFFLKGMTESLRNFIKISDPSAPT